MGKEGERKGRKDFGVPNPAPPKDPVGLPNVVTLPNDTRLLSFVLDSPSRETESFAKGDDLSGE